MVACGLQTHPCLDCKNDKMNFGDDRAEFIESNSFMAVPIYSEKTCKDDEEGIAFVILKPLHL